jgi:hypothetical protein
MSVRKQVSIHGHRAYVTDRDMLAGRGGIMAGGIDKPAVVLPGAPDTVALFEDFLGTWDDTGKPMPGSGLRAVVGDTGHTSNILDTGTNGVYRLLNAISTGAVKSNAAGVGLTGSALQWKANQGPGGASGWLRFGARLKLAGVTQAEATGSNRIHMFAGFTDHIAWEFPAYDTGAGLIGAADDFVGFLFSPGGDTGLAGVSGRAGTDQTVHLDTGINANEYVTLEIEVSRGPSDTGGMATFYIDGEPKGSIVSPITSSVALTPVVMAFVQDTGDNYVDIDWVNVAAPRDTGL